MQKIVVELCLGSSCFARGNAETLAYLETYIATHHQEDCIELTGHLCLGNCSQGPNVKIAGKLYTALQPEEVVCLVEKALTMKEGFHG
ncbi:MAG: (2Fe-2S) ferredoxin domain-containing protein [Sphaerochaetaceae bacterium]|jgi:NADH:ubiquinone oxidoreductase subunit E|nr:(2Fe-2S) ferredoxin domain-containing protein [Sphaerochaetaceae bacterium]